MTLIAADTIELLFDSLVYFLVLLTVSTASGRFSGFGPDREGLCAVSDLSFVRVGLKKSSSDELAFTIVIVGIFCARSLVKHRLSFAQMVESTRLSRTDLGQFLAIGHVLESYRVTSKL